MQELNHPIAESKTTSAADFARRHLPHDWTEADLQWLVRQRLRQVKLLEIETEEQVLTPYSTRRIDLSTWFTIYECKKYLTYDNLYKALGQSELYAHYGSKILWLFPKRRILIGLTPEDPTEAESAYKLANDIKGMGIEVIFLNEHPEWHPGHRSIKNWVYLLALLGFCFVVGLTSFLLVALTR